MSGRTQYLTVLFDFRGTHNHGHLRARPVGFQCYVNPGISGSDDHHILKGIGVGLVIVVFHFGQVFPGYVHPVRITVESGCNHHFLSLVGGLVCSNREIAVITADGAHLFIKMHGKLEVLGYPPIVFQGLPPGGFDVMGNKRYAPDFKSV